MPVVDANGAVGYFHWEAGRPTDEYMGISRTLEPPAPPRKPLRRHWRDAPWEYSAKELMQNKVDALLDLIYGEKK
jgi:hypothetical protein